MSLLRPLAARHDHLQQHQRGREFKNLKENRCYLPYWYVGEGVRSGTVEVLSEDGVFADQRDDSAVYLPCSCRCIVRIRVEREVRQVRMTVEMVRISIFILTV